MLLGAPFSGPQHQHPFGPRMSICGWAGNQQMHGSQVGYQLNPWSSAKPWQSENIKMQAQCTILTVLTAIYATRARGVDAFWLPTCAMPDRGYIVCPLLLLRCAKVSRLSRSLRRSNSIIRYCATPLATAHSDQPLFCAVAATTQHPDRSV